MLILPQYHIVLPKSSRSVFRISSSVSCNLIRILIGIGHHNYNTDKYDPYLDRIIKNRILDPQWGFHTLLYERLLFSKKKVESPCTSELAFRIEIFYFGLKITKLPGSGFEDLEKIPNEKSRKYRMPGIQDFFGIFYLRDGDFFPWDGIQQKAYSAVH